MLLVFGFVIFLSSSMSLAVRDNISLYRVVGSQFVIGILGSLIVVFLFSRVESIEFLKKYSWYLFVLGILLTLLVFTPLGWGYDGGRRWLDLGFFSLQPAELLKLTVIVLLAKLFSDNKEKMVNSWTGLVTLGLILLPVIGIMFKQPDMDGLLTICFFAFGMYFVSGVNFKKILAVLLIGAVLMGGLLYTKPYIIQRVETFFNPGKDLLNAGYQINQSLIAIGSGQVTGKGFTQSTQKFQYLPEAISDSIFPIAAEEFGFVGSISIVIAFLLWAARGFYIANRTPSDFSRLLVVGIVIMVMFQVFMNIGSMTGILPLSGLPLPFFSKGGTSLLLTMIGVGIIINISKEIKKVKPKRL